MNFSNYNYCSIKDILADVLVLIDDEGTDKLNEKFYYRQCRQVIDDLNFTTFFNEVYQDLDIPTNLIALIPKNLWNIKEIYVYNAECQSSSCSSSSIGACAIEGAVKLYYKYNYITAGKGMGHTPTQYSHNRHNGWSDTFSGGVRYEKHHHPHWYNIQGGEIFLSDNCSAFNKMRIVANGLAGGSIDELQIIPPFVREAVVLKVSERACLAIKGKNIEPQRYRQMWADIKVDLYTPKGKGQGSVWDEAIYRLRRKDDKETTDLKLYLSKMGF